MLSIFDPYTYLMKHLHYNAIMESNGGREQGNTINIRATRTTTIKQMGQEQAHRRRIFRSIYVPFTPAR